MDYFKNEIVPEDGAALLRVLKQSDFEELKKIAYEEGMWAYNPMSVHDDASLQRWMDKAFADYKAKTRIPFVIIDKATGRTAGCTSYMNIAFEDARLEIGSTWLGKDFRSSGLNKHCKFLLVSYAIEKMGIIRVEFKTDVLNLRSRRALGKIGAFEEGILRSHMAMHDGRRRDTIYFSILSNEWEFVKQNHFRELL